MAELSDYTDAANSLGATAGGIFAALNKGSKTTPAPAPAKSTTNWGLVAGIAGGVFVLLIIVLSLGGRGK